MICIIAWGGESRTTTGNRRVFGTLSSARSGTAWKFSARTLIGRKYRLPPLPLPTNPNRALHPLLFILTFFFSLLFISAVRFSCRLLTADWTDFSPSAANGAETWPDDFCTFISYSLSHFASEVPSTTDHLLHSIFPFLFVSVWQHLKHRRQFFLFDSIFSQLLPLFFARLFRSSPHFAYPRSNRHPQIIFSTQQERKTRGREKK